MKLENCDILNNIKIFERRGLRWGSKDPPYILWIWIHYLFMTWTIVDSNIKSIKHYQPT